MRTQLARTIFVLLLAVSLMMFLTPVEQVPQAGPDDKVVHLVVFAVLAIAGRWARLPAVPLGLGLAAYAALTEVLQAVLPIGRHGDLRDLVADIVGVLAGLLAALLASRVARGGVHRRSVGASRRDR